MFTPLTHCVLPPFLPRVEAGYLTPFPQLRYCLVEFDVHKYHDALFAQYAVPITPVLRSSVMKRRAEYLAVRYAAQRLLRDMDCPGNVGSAPDRVPVWPSGLCGSLSHTDGYAIAVVAPAAGGRTPGVDIEAFVPATMKETAGLFTTPEERRRLAACGIDNETALLIAFSAKESLYKAFYPEVGRFFDFDAACLREINVQEKTFMLVLTRTLSPGRVAGSRIHGHYAVLKGHVITVIS
ncbi:MAG: 4'-phosphopantetheinyl transferase EntD [Candidatus Tokpelaia hoelldobleri]|uniref:Enterobactin synthase component D n=1 Tax=Candidatus Tokpelaia hoelldobleri TaxID=1902579 RepID=A0A1U9JU88_9HYPH|nr:MAG: 4'-phosphopantetheinyl transferase EntD [Candidatus Tokpelaia hoelldoblerii]